MFCRSCYSCHLCFNPVLMICCRYKIHSLGNLSLGGVKTQGNVSSCSFFQFEFSVLRWIICLWKGRFVMIKNFGPRNIYSSARSMDLTSMYCSGRNLGNLSGTPAGSSCTVKNHLVPFGGRRPITSTLFPPTGLISNSSEGRTLISINVL